MKRLAIYLLITLGLVSCKEKEESQEVEQVSEGRFTYVPSSTSGVTFANTLSNSDYFNVISFPQFYNGAGVAAGDINNDSLPDLYFVSNQWENKLYLNKGDLRFEDITEKSGMSGIKDWESSVEMVDLNGDGWLDLEIDTKQYINNHDLTFTVSSTAVGTQESSPSRDASIVDINNDGLMDSITPGRFPFDDNIIKTTSLQLANKMYVNHGGNLYSDIAWYAGVAATDWSSRPVVADFDNDGLKDIFVPNGVVGRVNDLDYLNAIDSTSTAEQRYSKMPSGAAPNFFFRQTADLKFEDVTEKWIGRQASLSNGASWADLDNDGDPDLVVNNTNSEAFILRNDLNATPGAKKKQEVAMSAQDALLEAVDLIAFKHNENAFNTLDKQRTIPFTNATRGPKISVADINRDKLDDVFIAGGQKQPGAIFIQTKAGKFVQIPQPAFEADKHCEETCSAFFDVDGDRDMDLMIGSGGEEFLDKRISLRLYINNGRGTFMKADGFKRADIVSNLQKIYVNASCIVPADVDNDKDIDVFVGGAAVTGRYGVDSDSFILLNDGKGMLVESPISFENRQRPGSMVQAAVWTNINGDEFPDLVTAGEWTPVTIWLNNGGVLKQSVGNGLDSTFGWWTSLAVDDMDGDGDADIVAGNFGLNTRMQASVNEPIELILSDIDFNGRHDPLLTYYNKGQRYPFTSRDALVAQAPAIGQKYPTYTSYANATVDQLTMSKKVLERRVNILASAYFENKGGGKFVEHRLPPEAQYFPVLGIKTDDVNGDGKKDILFTGNLTAVNPEIGPNAEGYGLVLVGKGNGEFEALSPVRSGFIVRGEGRDIQSLTNFRKEKLYLVTRNNDSLIVFKKKDIK